MQDSRRFVPLPLDKHEWSPSPLPGQVVLVTTVDGQGRVDVAPKSWVTMVAFDGPTVGFGCSRRHRTHRNIEATGEFVINVPNASLAAAVWRLPEVDGPERLARAGLSLQPATAVAPPVVSQCPAHLECRHRQTITIAGEEVFILGTVTALAVDEACLAAPETADRYAGLNPFFFLQDGWFAGLDTPRRA